MTSESSLVRGDREIEQRWGRLDILVSIADIGIAVPTITEMSLSAWRRQAEISEVEARQVPCSRVTCVARMVLRNQALSRTIE